MRRAPLLAVVLGLAGCGTATPSADVSPGDLPPIQADYGARVARWARGFYADPRSLRNASISDPELVRDSSGRLVWLVCVEADAAGTLGPERQAIGFAPSFVSTPLARSGSTLSRADCGLHALKWRPWTLPDRS